MKKINIRNENQKREDKLMGRNWKPIQKRRKKKKLDDNNSKPKSL